LISPEFFSMSRSPVSAAPQPLAHAFLAAICLTAALGGFLFGYDWVVIGGAKPFYEPFFRIPPNSWLQGFTMSSALFGCLIGAPLSGPASDRLGRRTPLILAATLFTLSALWTALAPDLVSFNLARALGGVGIGLASNISPLYIAEISPSAHRGRFVSLNQLTIVIGILAAQIVNWRIAGFVAEASTPETLRDSWNTQFAWRWMFAAESFPALLFFFLACAIPESPRWLVRSSRLEPARRILERVGGPHYAQAELVQIRASLAAEHAAPPQLRDLADPSLRKVLALGILLAVFQQWCGINVIFNYAQEVFQAAGYTVNDILWNIVITGAVNLLFTLIAIAAVDRLGRRPLMLAGAAGLALIYAVLGLGYFLHSRGPHMVALVVAAIACYAMSLAPVTWVVIAEIFPNRIRGTAMSVAVFALWMACTALTFSFPLLNRFLGPHGAFWLYGAVCLAGLLFLSRHLPETKNRSLEQIEQMLIRSYRKN
jgi:SP family sugar porter-like MFS transporter